MPTIRSVEQPIDDANVVHDPAVETNATHIIDEMVANEADADEVADEVVHPNVVIVD